MEQNYWEQLKNIEKEKYELEMENKKVIHDYYVNEEDLKYLSEINVVDDFFKI